MFLDLRGFTSVPETSEPEELIAVFAQYPAEVGKGLINYQGTLEHFATALRASKRAVLA